jgi:hypothetical protein
MAFNFSPTSYNAKPLDFSALADLPDNFWKGQEVGRENELRSWIKANPDAPIDEVARHLMAADPVRGAQLLQSINNQEALNNSRIAGQVPDEIKLWDYWRKNGGGGGSGMEPMRASEPQPSGVPGMSFQNEPGFITDKFAPVGEKKRLEEVGKGQGERDAKRAMLEQDVAPGMQEIINTLVVNAKEADDETFKHALGPLQGAGEAETWQGALGNFLPQTWGGLENYYQQGKKAGFIGGEGMNLHIKEPGELPGGFTSTVRSKINSTQASLVSVLQRALRVPGIGAQSDAELRQIVNQVGELNKSRDKEDFYDRLSNVVSNLSNLGIPIKMPTVDEIAGTKPTSAAVQDYSQPTQAAAAPAYDAAEEAPPQAAQGSATGAMGIPGATTDPRSGYAKSIKKLDGPAIARIRNWAAEAIQAGVPRELVMQRLQELGYGQ